MLTAYQVILPYYFVPMEDGMYAHYEKLAEAIDIGIVIYNNPAFSGSWIQPPLMKKMLEGFGANGKIAGVKDNTPHMMSFDGMASVVKQFDVPLYSGFGEKWYKYQYPWGADGLATPFGNFFPEYPRDVFLASQKNDNKKVDELISMMQPYYAFVGRATPSAKIPASSTSRHGHLWRGQLPLRRCQGSHEPDGPARRDHAPALDWPHGEGDR